MDIFKSDIITIHPWQLVIWVAGFVLVMVFTSMDSARMKVEEAEKEMSDDE